MNKSFIAPLWNVKRLRKSDLFLFFSPSVWSKKNVLSVRNKLRKITAVNYRSAVAERVEATICTNTQQQQNVEATIVGLISCLSPALWWNSKSEKERSKNQKVLASHSGSCQTWAATCDCVSTQCLLPGRRPGVNRCPQVWTGAKSNSAAKINLPYSLSSRR